MGLLVEPFHRALQRFSSLTELLQGSQHLVLYLGFRAEAATTFNRQLVDLLQGLRGALRRAPNFAHGIAQVNTALLHIVHDRRQLLFQTSTQAVEFAQQLTHVQQALLQFRGAGQFFQGLQGLRGRADHLLQRQFAQAASQLAQHIGDLVDARGHAGNGRQIQLVR
ncbi:hypothetical protein D3C80_1672410 [compost metagenome]